MNYCTGGSDMAKIRVEDAAIMLGVTPQSVRIGLQRGAFPFGTAFKTKETNRTFNYVIYPEKLKEYAGEERFNKVMGC